MPLWSQCLLNSCIPVELGCEDHAASRHRPSATIAIGSRAHVDYLDWFRAVAILIIIAGHSYPLCGEDVVYQGDHIAGRLANAIPALLTGGTAYFVFISGFLYRLVFFGRTTYGEFMRKKALFVGLPYLILASPIALLEIGLGASTVVSSPSGFIYPHSSFVDFIALISTGRVITAYWYIPFIFIIFLASPLFDRFIALSRAWSSLVFLLSIGIAFWVVRPAGNLNPVHSFLYFANFYLLGILFCEHREAIISLVTRPLVIATLLLGIFAIGAVQALVMERVGNLERNPTDGWGLVGIDLMLVQKCVGVFLLCAMLSRWGAPLARPFEFIAGISFGLFFVHGIVIAILLRLPLAASLRVGEPLVDLTMQSTVVFLLSVLIVVAVRRVAGRASRFVIGC